MRLSPLSSFTSVGSGNSPKSDRDDSSIPEKQKAELDELKAEMDKLDEKLDTLDDAVNRLSERIKKLWLSCVKLPA